MRISTVLAQSRTGDDLTKPWLQMLPPKPISVRSALVIFRESKEVDGDATDTPEITCLFSAAGGPKR